ALKKATVWPIRNVQNLFYRFGTVPYQSIAPAGSPSREAGKPIIRVDRQVDHGGFSIYPSQDAYELVEKFGEKGQVALAHCFCRQWRKMADDPCRFGLEAESCLILGEMALHVIREEFGRAISGDEALAVLKKARDAGVVHTVFHERDNTDNPQAAVCNCCWDCCGVLGSYNRGIMPLHFKCYYVARIEDPDACTGCGECEWHCPTAAVKVVNGRVEVREEKCIGCGQCAHQCPNDVLLLDYRARDVFLPILKKSEARLA
ncbi:MAG: 4Fe-4S binding protein, partial [Pseudomonadota bacterium]